MKNPKPCMNPECDRDTSHRNSSRGLCGHCYRSAMNLVQSGRTTWAELEANGKCQSSRISVTKSQAGWFLDFKNKKR